jgi:hypothetical protein
MYQNTYAKHACFPLTFHFATIGQAWHLRKLKQLIYGRTICVSVRIKRSLFDTTAISNQPNEHTYLDEIDTFPLQTHKHKKEFISLQVKTTIMEVPKGNAPPESAPEVMENKNTKPTNSKRNFFLFMVLCGLLLTGVLVALVPDWDDNEEAKQKEQPYFKVFDPSLPIFNGTHAFIISILISVIMEEARTCSFLFVSWYYDLTNCVFFSFSLSIHPSIHIYSKYYKGL